MAYSNWMTWQIIYLNWSSTNLNSDKWFSKDARPERQHALRLVDKIPLLPHCPLSYVFHLHLGAHSHAHTLPVASHFNIHYSVPSIMLLALIYLVLRDPVVTSNFFSFTSQ